MDRNLKRIKTKSILFLSVETEKRSEVLKEFSVEHELYAYNTRNRETGEEKPFPELELDYNINAKNKLGFNKISKIDLAYILDGTIFTKSLSGEEVDILKQFYSILDNFDYVCGWNITEWDIPLCRIRYSTLCPTCIDEIPDRFNDSNKKPWNLKNLISLSYLYRGTHYTLSLVDEVLNSYNLELSNDRIVNISNLFLTLLGYETIDKITVSKKENTVEKLSLLEELHRKNELLDIELPLIAHLKRRSGGNFKVSELNGISEILRCVYLRTDAIGGDYDTKDVKNIKLEEIKKFIKEL